VAEGQSATIAETNPQFGEWTDVCLVHARGRIQTDGLTMSIAELGERIMVANVLLARLDFLQVHLFWLPGKLKVFASYQGVLFHAEGNIVSGWHGSVRRCEAHRRALDQRELTAEILSL